MRRWGTLALVGAMAVLLGTFGVRAQIATPVVHAASTWSVQAGADPDQTANVGFTDHSYYPNLVTVNAGDTVSWDFQSTEPHTVTFDAGKVPPLAVEGFVPGPGPGDFNFTKVVLPLGPSGPTATYDGTTQTSSGIPAEPVGERMPFTLTFPKAGVYHYECAVHGSVMSGTVTVLPSGASLPETPGQAAARGQAELAGSIGETHGALDFLAQTAPAPGDATVHTVAAGFSNLGMNVQQFTARDISVHRGETVIWNNPSNDFHTVSFLSGGTPPPVIDVRPQPAGPPMFIIPAATASPVGGNTFTGSGILSSGFLTPANFFAVKIDAPPGTYEFVCLLHGDDFNMKGTITVTQ